MSWAGNKANGSSDAFELVRRIKLLIDMHNNGIDTRFCFDCVSVLPCGCHIENKATEGAKVGKYKVRADSVDEWEEIEAKDGFDAAVEFVKFRQEEWGLDEGEDPIQDDVMVETPEGALLHFRVDTYVAVTHKAVAIVLPDLEPEDLDGEDGDL